MVRLKFSTLVLSSSVVFFFGGDSVLEFCGVFRMTFAETLKLKYTSIVVIPPTASYIVNQ